MIIWFRIRDGDWEFGNGACPIVSVENNNGLNPIVSVESNNGACPIVRVKGYEINNIMIEFKVIEFKVIEFCKACIPSGMYRSVEGNAFGNTFGVLVSSHPDSLRFGYLSPGLSFLTPGPSFLTSGPSPSSPPAPLQFGEGRREGRREKGWLLPRTALVRGHQAATPSTLYTVRASPLSLWRGAGGEVAERARGRGRFRQS
jgi:hypothetical protein